MSQGSLENFGAHRLAMELFDLVVEDMGAIERDARTYRLIAQQVASADSICSKSKKDTDGKPRRITRISSSWYAAQPAKPAAVTFE